ncbi:MAG: hypothetical protein JNK85_24985 [Verrucomicrobiales bacterium]|nr:hypothetical protein [Verrucomicrobiales bacterium]
MTVLHLISTGVLVLVALGLGFRRRPPVHRAFMLSAFTVDLLMVLYIEFTRHAVGKAVATTSPILRFHVVISTLVLAAYLVQLVLGWRLSRGPGRRVWHVRIGISFVVLRLTNYVTSFLIS